VNQLVATKTAHVSLTRGPRADRYGPRPVLDVHTVKVKQLVIIAAQHAIASVIIKRINRTRDHQLVNEP
jgi:hypothetical protein